MQSFAWFVCILGRFGALNGPSTLEDLESKRGFVANGYPPAEGNNKP